MERIAISGRAARLPVRTLLASALLSVLMVSCSEDNSGKGPGPGESSGLFTKMDVAKMLSCLPMEQAHLDEVHDAATASSGNGYDEEYMMRDLIESPGAGVGDDAGTRAAAKTRYATPLRSLIEDYLSQNPSPGARSGIHPAASPSTKLSEADIQKYLDDLVSSGMQIYWPYSEDWDGETYPLITFDPGYGSESNYGYLLSKNADGTLKVDSVYVDENLAKTRPVWVINTNDDSAYTPLELSMDNSGPLSAGSSPSIQMGRKASVGKTLYLKSFTMLRNYDSWFAGASEFWIKCGSVKGFKASIEEDLQRYTPSITDMVIVVKRKQLGEVVPFQAILATDFTDQMDKLAFMITEDDGGKSTVWNCSATVKIKSKSYGFEMSIPYRQNDDIVWRGQLSASYFNSSPEVTGRFGDVSVTFALE